MQAFLRWFLALTGALAGCGFAVWLTLWISIRSTSARVPEVRAQDPAQAAATVQEAGLVARLQEGVYDPTIAAGRIAQARPPAGFQLKRGDTVLLYPSLGEATLRVPNLAGLPQSVAETELETVGLRFGTHSQVEGQGDAIAVVAQSPEAGTMVGAGGTVALLVNRSPGRRRYVMPDLVGAREDVAASVVRGLGFRLANLQRIAYQGLAPGIVLRQDPGAGAPVRDAAVVALWVSQ